MHETGMQRPIGHSPKLTMKLWQHDMLSLWQHDGRVVYRHFGSVTAVMYIITMAA